MKLNEFRKGIVKAKEYIETEDINLVCHAWEHAYTGDKARIYFNDMLRPRCIESNIPIDGVDGFYGGWLGCNNFGRTHLRLHFLATFEAICIVDELYKEF